MNIGQQEHPRRYFDPAKVQAALINIYGSAKPKTLAWADLKDLGWPVSTSRNFLQGSGTIPLAFIFSLLQLDPDVDWLSLTVAEAPERVKRVANLRAQRAYERRQEQKPKRTRPRKRTDILSTTKIVHRLLG